MQIFVGRLELGSALCNSSLQLFIEILDLHLRMQSFGYFLLSLDIKVGIFIQCNYLTSNHQTDNHSHSP